MRSTSRRIAVVCGCLVSVVAGVALWAQPPKKEPPVQWVDTPTGRWMVHDEAQPAPPVVVPGVCGAQETAARPPAGGTKPPDPSTIGIVRGTGPKPGGTLSQQMTAVVTIQAIDLKVPSVTIMTEDGSTMSFKVEDKKNLSGVKVGDKVQITYTQALAISVAAPKK